MSDSRASLPAEPSASAAAVVRLSDLSDSLTTEQADSDMLLRAAYRGLQWQRHKGTEQASVHVPCHAENGCKWHASPGKCVRHLRRVWTGLHRDKRIQTRS